MERGKIVQKLAEGLRTIGEGMAMNNPYGTSSFIKPKSEIEARAIDSEALHRDRMAIEADLGIVALDFESKSIKSD